MPRPIATYGLALAAVAVAGVARWLLDPWLGSHLPFFTLYLAVIFAAWFGGLKPGLLAVALGFVEGVVAFADLRFVLPTGDLIDFLDRMRFIVVGVCVSVICEALHRQRRRAEAQSDLMRVTLASIGDAVITTDGRGRITFLNAVAEAVTGWTSREALGLPLDGVFRTLSEQSRQPVESPATRVLREGVVVGPANHTVVIRKDGTAARVDHSAAPIRGKDGAIVGCVLVARDVTERNRAEEALRFQFDLTKSITDNATTAIFTIDGQGCCTFMNPAAEAMTGFSFDEVRGGALHDVIHHHRPDGSPYPMAECPIHRALSEHVGIVNHEDAFIRKNGAFVPVLVNAEPIHRDDASAGNVIEVRDITREKQAAEALRDADRRKDEFLATLAHELRNPLAPIRNSLELLKRASGDADVIQQARATMERQVLQLVRLVDDLIDVGRISRNKLDLRREHVELASVVHHAVEACRSHFEQAGQELTLALPSEPVCLHADPIRLAQVFENLLTNACKFTEPGGRVWLTAERQERDVVVTVGDTGVGIPADMLPRVFDLFTQVEGSLERSAGGLGIGLSLVKQLVQMHNGSVEAFSEGAGKGSAFVVRLPVLDEKPDAAPPEPAAARQTTRSRRILIVDDNRDAAASLARLLTMAGHETYAAHDGAEAWEAVQSLRPEAVLLDLGLPKLNGYELCRRVRDQPWGRDMTIVAVTGWGQAADRRRSQEAGFDAHVVKPVDYTALEALLQGLRPPASTP